MTAPAGPISSAPPAAAPPPAGVQWIDLDEAARRAGYSSSGVIRRFHLQKFIDAGLARLEKPPVGRSKWYVREDADPKFARVKQPQQLGTEILRCLTDSQRKAINDRLRLVKLWEEQRAAGVKLGLNEAKITASFLDRILIDEGKRISRSTLFNWLRGYRREGIAGLADARWTIRDRMAAPPADPFLDEVKRLYLSLRRPKLTVCHEIACLRADEQGWTKRSYKACQRFIDTLDRAVVLKYRFGEEAHTNDAEPFIERDYSTLAANEIWCGDHHQFDVIVDSGGKLVRPWLTAWQDVRSRKIVGWAVFAHDPNQDTILMAFRGGVLSHGVPSQVYIDNGKDYDSYALQGMTKMQRRRRRLAFDGQHVAGVFTQLGVGVTHCEPYHGQSKPIERFFGTLEDRFGRTWETYCGNSPANKPEDLEAKLKAGKAPSLADFIAAFELWLENDYHARGHAGDGMDGRSPAQVFTETLAAKRTASPELVDLLLLKPTRPLRVTQNGVTYDGLRYGQYEPALRELLGAEVTLRVDPKDLTRVSVWTLQGRFVCLAPANAKVPWNADEQTKREAIAAKKRMRRVMKDYHQVRPRLSEDLTDLMTRAAAAKNRAAGTDRIDPTLPPPSLRPVRSPLEEQLPAIQRAYERPRIAVGAEGVSDLALGNYVSSSAGDTEGATSLGDVTDYLRYRPEVRDE